MLDAVSQAGLVDRTDVVIVSDHGFLPLQKQLQPNFVFKREGLLTTNDRGQVTSWEASFHSSGGSGFVYLKRPDDRALVSRVGGLLAADRGRSGQRVEKVWSQAELRQAGAHPDASFGLTMKPGFYTGWGARRVAGEHDEQGRSRIRPGAARAEGVARSWLALTCRKPAISAWCR